MKILIVCSYRNFIPDGINKFIKEQGEAAAKCLRELDNETSVVEYYLVRGKGIVGYLREIPKLRKKIREYRPDIIHAHYGLCGLLANMTTRRIPVVTTYHGSDINVAKSRKYSLWTMRLSAWNIYVSKKTMDLAGAVEGKKCSLIPCGVDLTNDQLQSREESRNALGWNNDAKKVLFAGMYMDDVKGPKLAKAAIEDLRSKIEDIELIELRGYTREEVNRLMCAVDCILMASKTEGSPQVIKEAMACGCPIVSTDVGDVAERVKGIDGCYIVYSRDAKEMAEAVEKAFAFKGKTKGREKIINDGLDNSEIVRRLLKIYERVKR